MTLGVKVKSAGHCSSGHEFMQTHPGIIFQLQSGACKQRSAVFLLDESKIVGAYVSYKGFLEVLEYSNCLEAVIKMFRDIRPRT